MTINRSFSYKYQVERTNSKCKRDLVALKTMLATKIQQRLQFLVFNSLILSVIHYEMGISTISSSQASQNLKEYTVRGSELSWVVHGVLQIEQ